jgi:hypothetical protein
MDYLSQHLLSPFKDWVKTVETSKNEYCITDPTLRILLHNPMMQVVLNVMSKQINNLHDWL